MWEGTMGICGPKADFSHTRKLHRVTCEGSIGEAVCDLFGRSILGNRQLDASSSSHLGRISHSKIFVIHYNAALEFGDVAPMWTARTHFRSRFPHTWSWYVYQITDPSR